MEVIHPRCAGIDISKKDAKVCVRVQGRGSRSTVSTVSTWGAMTGQILDLKEHLLKEGVSLVVMEATGDYWRPFYYLLEDEASTWSWSTPVMPGMSRAARPMSLTLPNSRIWVPTGWSVPRLFLRRRSVNCVISPGPGLSSPGNGPGRSSGWRSSLRTPASSSPRWPRTSRGSRDG